MNKTRLEALTDGTFAIVLTLLVIEIRVPEHLEQFTSNGLWHALSELTPLFIGYAVSGVVLAMFWISHNFFYGMLVKNINRQLAGLNILYLALISLIPFFSHMLGRYVELPLAVALYGVNILIISVLAIINFQYAISSHEIDTSHVTKRILLQAAIRQGIMPVFTILGIVSALYFSIPLALVLYMFPVIVNVIPGSLDLIERIFGFNFGERV